MELTVARIGRPHGLRGEVLLDVRTDAPEERLVVGARFATQPVSAGPLTLTSVRRAQERWYVTLDRAPDRTAVEALRGVELVVDADADADDDEDAWYPHQLVGLRVEHVADGRLLGEVVGLEHLPAHDVLVVREPAGERTRVPFVRAIVPVVDVPGGRVVLDPPGGLLAADAASLVVDDEA
ncbi:ribosome maturation factor RimM [Cellulomonas oligotrophica]|uniref:Ribosome maturation factor RimM n=1 Tax=Cellulomonas oligotrophica TaxID=931536 RepID=A0A7Y9FIT6_9CELL|nr:ribosome maturation factor RimM [Cellulomonas oligotrophica]NYD88118.1 16S rRNA processing protein RimM [Cellulomonas oligotrophica]GIG33625.1 ribosome maturation factor RimM [Cellulomonas oligotrophica]